MINTMQLLQSIYTWNEQDRRRLAQDLHDTVLQEQIVWYREVVKLLEIEQLPLLVSKKIDELAEGMLGLIDELRYYCQEVRPPYMLHIGLKKALEQLFNKFHLRSNIEILSYIQLKDHQHNEQLALHMFRIVQELLSNAIKHSMAKYIMLEIYENSRTLRIDYYDDGIGMEDVANYDSIEHMGISGIYYRAASLGGMATFQSEVDQGMSVQVVIPL